MLDRAGPDVRAFSLALHPIDLFPVDNRRRRMRTRKPILRAFGVSRRTVLSAVTLCQPEGSEASNTELAELEIDSVRVI